MSRKEAFRQLTIFTYILEMMRQDDEIRGIQTIDQGHVQSGKDGQNDEISGI